MRKKISRQLEQVPKEAGKREKTEADYRGSGWRGRTDKTGGWRQWL